MSILNLYRTIYRTLHAYITNISDTFMHVIGCVCVAFYVLTIETSNRCCHHSAMQHLPNLKRMSLSLAQISLFILFSHFPKHLIDCDSSSDIAN